MACCSHSRRPPVPLPPEPFAPPPAGSAVKQSLAWFEIQSVRELRPADGAPNPGTTPPADTVAKQWASSRSTCLPTNSPLPGSYRVCRFDRSTAERLLRNAFPAWENPYHPQSTPPPDRVSAWLAALPAAPAPASPRHSRARPPPSDGVTDACDEHCMEPSARPSARHSCALRATTIPCSSSSRVCAGRRAPRRWPDPRYMPRSASVVGLAKRGVIPRKQFYIKLFFYNTVILGRRPRFSPDGEQVVYWSGLDINVGPRDSQRILVVPAGGGSPRLLSPGFLTAR